MSNVYFISDLHFGHKSIIRFARDYRKGKTIEEHDAWLVKQYNSVVNKKDKVFILGDICWNTKASLSLLGQMNGRKILVLGNHDKMHIDDYRPYFENISGPFKYKGYWVTHIPMHPVELWGLKNIHGHVHQNYVKDNRYINVCVETNQGMPISFQRIENGTHRKYYTHFIDNIENAKA